MTLADDLVTIDGLPLHPLVVHAVVVLLPLSAAGTVLIAVRPAWRRRFGSAVAALTVLAVAMVPVAQQTGEQLEDKLEALENPLIEQHAELGETLLPYAITFAVLVLALVLAGALADRQDRGADTGASTGATAGAGTGSATGPGTAATSRSGLWRALVVALAVLAVLSATATTVRVIQIGHSGSTAVWDGIAELPDP